MRLRATALCLAAMTAALPGRADEPAPYVIVDGREIPDPLGGETGNARRGAGLFTSDRAGCATCHGVPGAERHAGAPVLTGVGDRLSQGALRLWIVAPMVFAPQTEMPGAYLAGQRLDARDPGYGGPLLSAREVEDLVAYLAGLKAP